jgi:hypothetical protein
MHRWYAGLVSIYVPLYLLCVIPIARYLHYLSSGIGFILLCLLIF